MLAYESPIVGSPDAYARKLATYITSPHAVYLACRREYGRNHPGIPSPSKIDAMIAKTRAERAAMRRNAMIVEYLYLYPIGPRLPKKPDDRVSEDVPALPAIALQPQAFPRDLLRAISIAFGLSFEAVLGKKRFREFIIARVVVAKILHERGLSYNQIGGIIGGRDHSTIINLVAQFPVYMARHPYAMRVYEAHRGEKKA